MLESSPGMQQTGAWAPWKQAEMAVLVPILLLWVAWHLQAQALGKCVMCPHPG